MAEDNLSELAGADEPVDDKLLNAIIAPGAKSAKPAAPQQKQAAPQVSAPVNQSPAEVTPEDLPEDATIEPQPVELEENTPFEVMVDGKPQTVTLKQLRENYSGEAAIQSRLQQSAEARNHFVEQASQLYQANQLTLQRLQQLDGSLQQFAQPQLNDQQWEYLRQTNPQQYLIMRDQQRAARDQQEALRREAAEVQQKQEFINSQAKQQYIDGEAQKLFARIPEMADPDKRETLMGSMMEALTHYGYTAEELKDVTDHRVFVALADAAKYRALLRQKAGVTGPQGSASTPNPARRVPSRTEQQKTAEITKRARDSGRPDDVALTLIQPRQRQTLSGNRG